MLKQVQRLAAVAGHGDFKSVLVKQVNGDRLVDAVVLGEEHSSSGSVSGSSLSRCTFLRAVTIRSVA